MAELDDMTTLKRPYAPLSMNTNLSSSRFSLALTISF
jgi:hypothetical protein